MDKMDLDLLQGTPPLLLALTGLVTFTAVLVGCVYTRQKQNKREGSYKVCEGKERDEPEGADEEQNSEDTKNQVVQGQWPVGKSAQFTDTRT